MRREVHFGAPARLRRVECGQAAVAAADDRAALAFEMQSCCVGAYAHTRLLGDVDALAHARTAIEARLARLAS